MSDIQKRSESVRPRKKDMVEAIIQLVMNAKVTCFQF